MKQLNLNLLNQQQREAVEYFDSPLLIFAGAGSGKTKTIVYKAAYAIEKDLSQPERLLLVTFTNKAAKEMKQRVFKLVEKEIPHVGTFHSLAAKILRKDGDKIGLERSFVIYDQQDQLSLVKEIIKDLDLGKIKASQALYAISAAKQEMIEAKTYEQLVRDYRQEIVAKIYREYEKRLAKYGGVDFDDLLMKTVKLWQENETSLEKYQDLFKYIFVDEYQDTNTAQYLMTKLLAKTHQHLCVVGDVSQSIYRWRGANYRNIMKIKNDFPKIKEIRLERNYRSTQNILAAAEQVIRHNTTHPTLSLWTDKEDGERISLIEASSAKDEVKQIIREIEKWREKGKSWQDIAILYRTNAQSRVLEEGLVRRGIPYVLVGGIKFYERAEIKDVLAYLRLVYNPNDGVAWKRAEKIGKRRLARLKEALRDFDYRKYRVNEILEMIYSATDYLSKYDKEVSEDLARLENLQELNSLAIEYEKLEDFLENVSLVQAEYYMGEKGKEKEVITLMTLHAAKGLEFPIVFMVGMEEGLFPHSRSLMDKEELEEERRLCYVGITRAKEKLYLSYAKQRLVYGNYTNNSRSRFIDEIDPDLLDDSYQNHAFFNRSEKNEPQLKPIEEDVFEAFLEGKIDVDELL